MGEGQPSPVSPIARALKIRPLPEGEGATDRLFDPFDRYQMNGAVDLYR